MSLSNLLTPDEQALLNVYRQLVNTGIRSLSVVADDFARLTRRDAIGTEAADAYMRNTLGIGLPLAGWYSQGYYWDHGQAIGTTTIRFELEGGGYWERLLDHPERFGKQKARFKPGMNISDAWWCAPGLELQQARTLYLVESIFDAITLCSHGITAVAIMTGARFPEKLLARLTPGCVLIWSLGHDPAGQLYARKHATKAQALGFPSEVKP